jgi:AraC-like DNA-binding protein/quercetin dioxygenase-like cupin family protein
MKLTPNAPSIADFSWLSEVEESGPRLNQQSPIQVRHFVIPSGLAMVHPECHPYCELGLHLSGCGSEFVEREKIIREAGDLFIAGPGVPHWFKASRYPLTGVVIYFLPSLLCEFGPKQDGLDILRRFTSKQTIQSRLVRPSPGLRKRLTLGFETIHREFEGKSPGREIRLRTLLMDMLVDLVRWERKIGRQETRVDSSMNWRQVNQALQFLRDHFAEPVYAHDVASAAGLSESRLKVVFREALGMPWSRYIQGYRIQQAVALLGASNGRVTEAALAVGFESLSHFNATFRSFMGMSPSAYLKSSPKP